jgi:hypothetical protein
MVCDVIPDPERSAARNMALFHVAYTLPQVVAAAVIARPLAWLNESGHNLAGLATGGNLGYRLVFASAGLWFLLATVLVRRVRGVR